MPSRSNAAGLSPSSSSGRLLARVHKGRREEGGHGKVRTFENCMIHQKKAGKLRKLNFENFQSSKTFGITKIIHYKYYLFLCYLSMSLLPHMMDLAVFTVIRLLHYGCCTNCIFFQTRKK